MAPDYVNVTYAPTVALDTITFVDIYSTKKNYDFFQIPMNYPNHNYTYFNMTISQDTIGNDYSGSIFIQSNSTKSKQMIPVEIHINNSNPIDFFATPVIVNPIVYPDEDLEVHISIHKSIYPQSEAKMEVIYCAVKEISEICNISKPMYDTETLYLKQWLNFTRFLNTTNMSLDSYSFKLEVYYAGDPVAKEKSNTFILSEIPSSNPPTDEPEGTPSPPTSIPSTPEPAEDTTVMIPIHKSSIALSVPLVVASSREQTESFIVELENNGDYMVESGHISIYGIPDGWITVEPAYQNIPIGGKVQYNISLTIPLFADIESEFFMSVLFYEDDTFKISKSSKVILSDTLSDVARRLIIEAEEYESLLSLTLAEFKDFDIVIETDCEGMSCEDALYLSDVLLNANKTTDSINTTNNILESYALAFEKINEILEQRYIEKRQTLMDRLLELKKEISPETQQIISKKLEESQQEFYDDDNVGAYRKLQEIELLLDTFNTSAYWKKWTYMAILSALILIVAIIALYITEEHKIKDLTRHTVKRHLHRMHTSIAQKRNKKRYEHKSSKT